VEIIGPAGPRSLPLAELWTGIMTTALASDELVVRIIVPIRPGRHAFIKLGRKSANTPAVVTVAVHAVMDGELVREPRVVLGAAGPYPMRSAGAEAVISGRELVPAAIAAAAAAAIEDAEPFSDSVASDWYRHRMVGVVVERALAQLAQPIERGA